MRRPIIHDGQPFDWKAGSEAARRAVRDDGSVKWAAAMAADPGVMKCPGCDTYLWREGRIVECPDCGEAWNEEKRSGDRHRAVDEMPEKARTGMDP